MEGPQIWGPLLNQLRAAASGRFVVAGGAVRDYLLGLEAKDIDVFCDCVNRFDMASLALSLNLMDGFSVYLMDCKDYAENNTYVNGVIAGTWTYEGEEYEINVVARPMLRTSANAMVRTFDYGILQCWWDLTSTNIERTKSCEIDLEGKFATLMHGRTINQSLNRFKKFTDRNGPVLTFRDPQNWTPL